MIKIVYEIMKSPPDYFRKGLINAQVRPDAKFIKAEAPSNHSSPKILQQSFVKIELMYPKKQVYYTDSILCICTVLFWSDAHMMQIIT